MARHFIDGHKMKEGALNRVSAVVRAYDRCLSCSTQADGTPALEIALKEPAAKCWTGSGEGHETTTGLLDPLHGLWVSLIMGT
ncbi:MAG: hypothetical protein WBL65_06280 [Bryobacteraceae bacterium]